MVKKDEIERIVRISVYSSVIIAGIVLYMSTLPIDVAVIFRALSTGLTVTTLFWAAYFKWLWKSPGVKHILYRPNINGTWSGLLVSDWRDENGVQVEPKKIFIIVRQNLLKVSVTSFTNNFIGVSYSENFILDEEKGIRRLVYLYKKDTSDSGIQERNEGASEFRVIEAKPIRMEGLYWSNNKTNGTIKVEKISDTYIESYEDGVNLLI